MKPQIITGRFDVTGNLDCIELREDGYISIPNTMKELTIKQLINNKTEDSQTDFEILVTGKDGEDALYGSGKDGKPGEDGATVRITVLELVGDVYLKAGGGMGGAGGKGVEGPDGGRGGRGGNGGNGAKVEFTYTRQDHDSTSSAYVLSAEGGIGGKGGSGGICTGSFGLGGKAGQPGTAGAKYGDGGDGGANGQPGTITIHHPDGGCTVNGFEQRDESDNGFYTESPTGAHILDLRNPRDFRRLIQGYGGEKNLKKYPLIREAVMRTRELAARDGAFRERAADVTIHGNITQITPMEVDSDLYAGELDGDYHSYYQFRTMIETSFANSTVSMADKSAGVQPLVPIGYMLRIQIRNKTSGYIIYNTTLYNDEGDTTRGLDDVITDAFPCEKLYGEKFRMTAIVTYEFNDGTIISSALLERDFEFDENQLESFIKQVTITAPHWHSGKNSGDIMFLYGRTTSSSPEYVDADYWDKDGPYYKNNFHDGILRTIIPMSGTVELNDIAGVEISGVSIGSYILRDGVCPISYLDYNIGGSRKAIAFHRADQGTSGLGQALQANGDLTYNKGKNLVTFDLKLPPMTAGKSDYDWECNLSGGFLDDSSHRCYLNGCLVLKVSHSEILGSEEEIYPINIFSEDNLPKTQEKYYIGAKGATNIIIPPIVIYWGCYASETLVRAEDGTEIRVDKIGPGDKLRAFGNKILTVAEVLTGMEQEIYKIKTEDGNHIRVSGGHGMKVFCEQCPEGKKVGARHLKKGDLLMTPKGSQAVEEVLVEEYDGLVYNFIFQEESEPNYIEANGYWSGDFYAQNESTEIERPRSEESILLSDEMRRFAMDSQG